MEDDGGVQGSAQSGEENEHNGQANGTSDAATENRASDDPARDNSTVTQPNNMSPEQQTALEQFFAFKSHGSLEKYEEILTSAFSAEHGDSIQLYIQGIKGLFPLSPAEGSQVLDKLFHDFCHRLVAIEAKKEAGRRQDHLL
jgi:hypothetical protein